MWATRLIMAYRGGSGRRNSSSGKKITPAWELTGLKHNSWELTGLNHHPWELTGLKPHPWELTGLKPHSWELTGLNLFYMDNLNKVLRKLITFEWSKPFLWPAEKTLSMSATNRNRLRLSLRSSLASVIRPWKPETPCWSNKIGCQKQGPVNSPEL